MTFTAGTVEKPGETGMLRPRYTEFNALDNDRLAQVLGAASVSGRAATTTNDNDVIINLSAQGFLWQADHFYRVVSHVWARGNGSEYFHAEVISTVLGGATPVVVEETVIVDHDGAGFDAAAPGIVVTSQEVTLEVTGVTDNPANWYAECFVGEPKLLTAASA